MSGSNKELSNLKVYLQGTIDDLASIYTEAIHIIPSASPFISVAISELEEAIVEVEEKLEQE